MDMKKQKYTLYHLMINVMVFRYTLGGHTDYVGILFYSNLARAFNLEINLSTNIFFVFTDYYVFLFFDYF